MSVFHRGKKGIGQNSTSISPKGNQNWMYIGRTDAEAEAPKLRPPDAKSWLIGKNLDAEKIEGRRRWGGRRWDIGGHHLLNGHEFEQTLGDSEGQETRGCHSITKNWTLLSDWTTASCFFFFSPKAHNNLELMNKSLIWPWPPDLPLEKPVCRSGGNS